MADRRIVRKFQKRETHENDVDSGFPLIPQLPTLIPVRYDCTVQYMKYVVAVSIFIRDYVATSQQRGFIPRNRSNVGLVTVRPAEKDGPSRRLRSPRPVGNGYVLQYSFADC
jgi:hypothetical protein